MSLKKLVREGQAQDRAADAAWKNSGINSGTRGSVYKAGFSEGVVWEFDRRPDWISVKDKLPTRHTRYAGKYGVQVLCYNEHEYPVEDQEKYGEPTTASFRFKEQEFQAYHLNAGKVFGEWLPVGVTHWMPFPPTPRRKK